MMVRTSCSVNGCSSSWRDKDLKFHRFPRDERRQLWIQACQRPDLNNKTIEQLYNMYVCGLHFEGWMYLKKKLITTAVPVTLLPPASHSRSTQAEAARVRVRQDLTCTPGLQQQIDNASVDVSVVAPSTSSGCHDRHVCTPTPASQTTTNLTDHSQINRKLRRQITSCAKKLKLMEDAESTHVTKQQFLRGCDKFLPPRLRNIVKAQLN